MRAARRRGVRALLSGLRRLLKRDFPEEPQLIPEIMDRFHAEDDRSAFGMMNAVTSLARDTDDPELRWRLEELGGAIAAGRLPTRSGPGDAILRYLEEDQVATDRRRAAIEVRPGIPSEQTCGVE
jgi:hypothetical protein